MEIIMIFIKKTCKGRKIKCYLPTVPPGTFSGKKGLHMVPLSLEPGMNPEHIWVCPKSPSKICVACVLGFVCVYV